MRADEADCTHENIHTLLLQSFPGCDLADLPNGRPEVFADLHHVNHGRLRSNLPGFCGGHTETVGAFLLYLLLQPSQGSSLTFSTPLDYYFCSRS